MKSSTRDTTKVRRPRAPAAGTPVVVRMQPEQLTPLDAWIAAQPDPKLTRPEAIREAVNDWLEQQAEDGNNTGPKPSAGGFFTAADGYRSAAIALHPFIQGQTEIVSPIFLTFYNAVGLSLELYFKAYLSISAYDPKVMQRKFGHKLKKLCNKAFALGMRDDFKKYAIPQAELTLDMLEATVSALAPQYIDNSLRYMSPGRAEYTYIENIHDVFIVIERLHYVVQSKLGE